MLVAQPVSPAISTLDDFCRGLLGYKGLWPPRCSACAPAELRSARQPGRAALLELRVAVVRRPSPTTYLPTTTTPKLSGTSCGRPFLPSLASGVAPYSPASR